ncbi:CPBP family intramembrane metalloprotease [Butyrivibrio sp. X503]|uniref:CPBP family intramembrane glutamic endopeptidase n=1 Tax=Butyrivibrio sp. X503 TaxID=2364878 RepID=UPI000EA9E52F|nr:type II CAAX endopeptidase family protein [Butyrivibrio sp. X503]RKM58135.1 CPBP family intramembrane metalloprotease [Butyrivibrio sp. X503]
MNKTKDKAEIIRLLLVFVAIMLVMVGMSHVVRPWFESREMELPLVPFSIVLYGLMIAIVLIYSFAKGDKFIESYGIKKIKVGTVFLTILLTFVSMPMGWFANVLSQVFVPNIFAQAADSLMEGSLLPLFVSMVVLAPICEELLMRGFFQNRFSKLLPFGVSAVLTGFLFGVLHMNLNQFCYAWVLGIIFAYVNRASGSMITSTIMHLIFNAVGCVVMFISAKVVEGAGMSVAEGAEAYRTDPSTMIVSLIVTGLLAVGSFFLTRLVIRAIAKKEGNEIQAKA